MKIKSDEKLSIFQTFKAMTKFLEAFYERTSSDDVGSLLSEMEILEDGNTADPAAWHDWIRSIEIVLDEERSEYQV